MPDPTPLTPYSILPKKKKWIIPGQDFKPSSSNRNDGSEIDVNLDIPETEGIVMPDKKEIFGLPVHARLAVFYIRKLWREIEKKRMLTIHRDTRSVFAVLRQHLDKNAKEFDKDDFVKQLNELDRRWEEANNWLIELLRNSFALTMDKSILLKTLSQPECEGIRYYLAMKRTSEPASIESSTAGAQHEKGNDDDDKNEQAREIVLRDSKGKPVKLTLVTVGVDKKGSDLHYEYKPSKHTLDTIPDIENDSLVTEYPRTPGISKVHKTGMNELEPYVLYKYAREEK